MKIKYDLSEFVDATTVDSVKKVIVDNLKKRRKEKKISQKELSIRSGVTYASIRRFETTGEISFSSLLEIANALDCLEEFNQLFSKKLIIANLKDL